MSFYAFKLLERQGFQGLGEIVSDFNVSTSMLAPLEAESYSIADGDIEMTVVGTSEPLTATSGGSVSPAGGYTIDPAPEPRMAPSAVDPSTLVYDDPVPGDAPQDDSDRLGDHTTSSGAPGYVWMAAGIGITALAVAILARN